MAATYILGPFRLDAETDTLFRGGEPVSLGHRAVALLRALVERPGIPVSKDALMEAAWAGLTVEESNLAVQIAALRRVFGEEPGGENWIETFPRRGYRFVGPASTQDKGVVTAASQAANFPMAAGSSNPTLPDRPSIAVLPFANISADPEQEYFADGMVEEIITALSRIRWLFVIARNSTFTYKGHAVDVKQVGRELGVRYVLEGSVRKAGDRVRITAQLIDALAGAHLWADRFDGALDDIFELQDQVTSSVVGAIEPKLRSSEIERAFRKPTENLSAYDLCLRAFFHFHKLTSEGNLETIRLLRQALEIDPSYATAAAFVGLCRGFQRAQGWGALSDQEVVEAVRLAKQALDTGKEDPETLWMAGLAIADLAGEHAAGMNAIDRSLALNPNSAYAWNASGWMRCGSKPDLAIEALERAMRLSPLDPQRWMFEGGLALAHMAAGRYEEAMEWADRALLEQPRAAAIVRCKVVLCGCLSRLDEARRWLARLLQAQPGLTVAELKAFAAASFVSPKILAIYV